MPKAETVSDIGEPDTVAHKGSNLVSLPFSQGGQEPGEPQEAKNQKELPNYVEFVFEM